MSKNPKKSEPSFPLDDAAPTIFEDRFDPVSDAELEVPPPTKEAPPPAKAAAAKKVVTAKRKVAPKKKTAGAKQGSKGARKKRSRGAYEFVVGVTVQTQEKDGKVRPLSIAYRVEFEGKHHSDIIELEGERPKLSNLVGDILIAAKAKGVFSRYPESISLVGHDTGTLMNSLKDGDDSGWGLDTIRSSAVSLRKPMPVKFADKNNNTRDVEVSLRDIRLLVSGRMDLGEVAELLSGSRGEIPPDGSWAKIREEDPERFKEVAIRSAEIAAEFAGRVADFTEQLLGKPGIPPTVGSVAESFAIRNIGAGRTISWEILGKEEILPDGRENKKPVLIRPLHTRSTLATECYHGGRNESFFYGISDEADWCDYDLCSAYPTVLASLGMPVWDEGFDTKDPGRFDGAVMGFARIRFSFPEGTRFPVIPVRVGEKLIFPLKGESYATAPEISLARRLGADVSILEGFVVPLDENIHPFEDPVKRLVEMRTEFSDKGDRVCEMLAKLVANSFHGKMGQGLPPKRDSPKTFNENPTCRITQPFLAAHTTGVVRATVGELLNNLPTSCQVLSVTTDGFITDAGQEEIAKATSGSLCTAMSQSRLRIAGSDEILKEKRRAKRLLCGRNRVIATLEPAPGHGVILSRSGIITPDRLNTEEQKNGWLVDQFLDRTPETKLRQWSFWDGRGTERAAGLDFDFDRRPVDPVERVFDGRRHVSFATKPWGTAEDYRAARKAFEEIRKKKWCLKCNTDLADLEELIYANRSTGKKASTVGGSIMEAKRQFLRALRRGECGMPKPQRGQRLKDIASKVNAALSKTSLAAKVKVTDKDLQNAGRKESKFVANSVPWTPRTSEFARAMETAFTGFDISKFLAPNPDATGT